MPWWMMFADEIVRWLNLHDNDTRGFCQWVYEYAAIQFACG